MVGFGGISGSGETCGSNWDRGPVGSGCLGESVWLDGLGLVGVPGWAHSGYFPAI